MFNAKICELKLCTITVYFNNFRSDVITLVNPVHNEVDIFDSRYCAMDIYTASLNYSKQVIFVVNLTLSLSTFPDYTEINMSWLRCVAFSSFPAMSSFSLQT